MLNNMPLISFVQRLKFYAKKGTHLKYFFNIEENSHQIYILRKISVIKSALSFYLGERERERGNKIFANLMQKANGKSDAQCVHCCVMRCIMENVCVQM